jgi:hypothetical protein
MLDLVQFTGPDNQKIDVNPVAVISVRAPRGAEHLGHGVKCLIHTADGKFIAVVEDCGTVKRRLEEQ